MEGLEVRQSGGWAGSGRRLCELTVAALICVIVIRTWLLEGLFLPVRVAGGSMATTLLGRHVRLTCSQCDEMLTVGLDQPAGPTYVCCPNCGTLIQPGNYMEEQCGERLWIDRTSLLFGPPQRWEVFVFRSPENPGQYCVKRVVGLPGESIQIRQGDVYRNGRIVRKSLSQQRAVAQLVHQSRVGGIARWHVLRGDSNWQVGESRFWFPPLSERTRVVDWFTYCHGERQTISDDVSYNPSLTRRLNEVRDLLLVCRVAVRGVGGLWLAAEDGRDRYLVEIHPAADRVGLYRNKRPLATVSLRGQRLREPTRLEISLFDQQLLVALDGTVFLRHPRRNSGGPLQRSATALSIGSSGLGLTVDRLAVWRDIYYCCPPAGRWGLDRPCRLDAEELFVLGDNSPISWDSRCWATGGGVPRTLFVGEALGVD